MIFITYLVRFEVKSNHLFEFEILEETKALTTVPHIKSDGKMLQQSYIFKSRYTC